MLRILHSLLEDLLVLRFSGDRLRNADLHSELQALAARVSYPWLRKAVRKVDELADLLRRNIQKNLALDALILELLRC